MVDKNSLVLFCSTDPKITFWQEGVYINCSDYHLLIEPVDEYLQSDVPHSEDGSETRKRGIVITVTKTSGEEDSSNLAFILATFAIDYIDSLIYQWYPGMKNSSATPRAVVQSVEHLICTLLVVSSNPLSRHYIRTWTSCSDIVISVIRQ